MYGAARRKCPRGAAAPGGPSPLASAAPPPDPPMRLLVPALALLLAACGGDAAESEAPAAPPTTSELAADMPDDPDLVVSSGGLRVATPDGADEAVPFGSPFDAAVEAIAAVRGAPAERLFVEMCDADYATWPPGLAVYGQDGLLVGWALDDAEETVTAAALRLGLPRADLDARGAEVSESTVGTEFAIDGVAGLLSGDDPDGTVTHLFAGSTCIAR